MNRGHHVECGGKRSATPLWMAAQKILRESKAAPVSPHSKFVASKWKRLFQL